MLRIKFKIKNKLNNLLISLNNLLISLMNKIKIKLRNHNNKKEIKRLPTSVLYVNN